MKTTKTTKAPKASKASAGDRQVRDLIRRYAAIRRQVADLDEQSQIMREALLYAVGMAGGVIETPTHTAKITPTTRSTIEPTRLLERGVSMDIIQYATVVSTSEQLRVTARKVNLKQANEPGGESADVKQAHDRLTKQEAGG